MKRKNLILLTMITVMTSVLIVGCGNKESKPEKPQIENAKTDTDEIENEKQEKTEKEETPVKDTDSKTDTDSKKDTTSVKDTDSKKDDVPKNNEKPSLKKEYLNKLDKIEKSMSDLKPLYDGITIEMKQAAAEKYARWDKALNEIYKKLQSTLPSNEFKALKNKQVEWIKYKESESIKAGKEAAGGTLENLLIVEKSAELTKERCYKLVNDYMS